MVKLGPLPRKCHRSRKLPPPRAALAVYVVDVVQVVQGRMQPPTAKEAAHKETHPIGNLCGLLVRETLYLDT